MRIDALILGNELQDAFLGLDHAVVALLKHLPRELYVPERSDSLVPRKPEHLREELSFARRFHFIFSIKRIYLFLKDLAHARHHVLYLIKHLLVLGLVALLVIFEHLLVCVLQETRLASFLELFGRLLNIIKLLVNDAMHFFVEVD